jgi:hypothetical protein
MDSILFKKILGLWGVVFLLLVSACSSIKVDKPILNHLNSNDYSLNKYWYSESGAGVIEKTDISDFRSKGLYILKNSSGIFATVRIASTDVRGRYIVQYHNMESEETFVSIAVLNTQDKFTIYSPITTSIHEKALTSPYLQGLLLHINKEGNSIEFDEYICENFPSNIISFIKSLDLTDFEKLGTYHSTNQTNVERIWKSQMEKDIIKYLDEKEK